MEVTSLNFEVVFPKIIDAYTRCDLISIDCEFSGIRCFDTDGMPIRTALRDAVLTVPSNAGRGLVEEGRDTELGSRMKEEGYRRLKSAAHKYTILQLGMTFVWIDKDRTHGVVFKSETYSFLVNPFLDWSTREGVKMCQAIERDVTVNSAAVQLLQSTKFDFSALFSEGLRYLAHSEENEVRGYVKWQSETRRREKCQQDVEEKEVERIRNTITQWLGGNGAEAGALLEVFPLRGKPMARSWLARVHDIVRGEFKDCRSWKDTKNHCIVIKHVDVAEDEKLQKERENRMSAAIRKAIGLRNVLDLILGNDLSEQIIPEEYAEAQVKATELEWDPKSDTEKDIEREAAVKVLTEKLDLLKSSRTRPILVGQNLGWDLAFIIEEFLQPLPNTLEEFVSVVDNLFPRLLDTRFLASNHAGSFKDLDLSGIHATLSWESKEPRLYWEPGMGYQSGSSHNAGYDSFMTAEVFLKMGQKLVVQGSERKGRGKMDQESINGEIVDWNSDIWDPFRGMFLVHGQIVRE